MEIIPAIDLIDGKCVRLTQGDYNLKTIYNENPLEVALEFQDNGFTRLHLVDLDGAKAGRIINYKILETISSKTNLEIDFGGGIKNYEDIEMVFNSGAKMAAIGSLAVKNPELFHKWICKYGNEKIFLGADVKNNLIAISGWLENTEINVFTFVKENLLKGVNKIFCTDISKDGKLLGPSIELYTALIKENPELQLTASGGVSVIEDIEKLIAINCGGVIIGKAIYEGRIKLKELQKYLN